jgi:SAM-dependent methyltransferase
MNILLRKANSAFIRGRRLLISQRFGFAPETIYRGEFYEDGGFAKTELSATTIADWAVEHLQPRSVIDLGSGAGYYLRAFKQRGIDCLGFEASREGVAAAGQQVTAISYDLKRPLHLSRRFDLAMCVEVAEHIPTKHSSTLVGSIARNSSAFVLFTAAPPGTPGTDHINCQPKEFWTRLFELEGFRVDEKLTRSLRETASRADTAEWWARWAWCLRRV